jgi:uncharacterized protein involved in copper resistance
MMRQFGIGAGLRKSGLGLQRHYEIIPELAPKSGVERPLAVVRF